jgi:AcrR family transcriptional regulator
MEDSLVLLDCVAQGLVTPTFIHVDKERRSRVIEAILAEAAERGMVDVNIKEVAKRSGLPVGSFYQYFPDRDGMLRFACLYSGKKLSDELRSWAPEMAKPSLREGLQAYVSVGLEWSRANTGMMRAFAVTAYQVAIREGSGGAPAGDALRLLVRPVAEAMQEMLRVLIEACARRGELKKDLPLESAVRFANLAMIGAIDAVLLPGLDNYYRLFDQDHPASAVCADFVDLLCGALQRE